MKKLDNQGFFKNLKYDFPAGIVVTLVAIPLCLGISLASGAPSVSYTHLTLPTNREV